MVRWVDLEELNDCLEGLLHEDQGLCERQDNMKKSGGEAQDKQVRDVMGEGERGQ